MQYCPKTSDQEAKKTARKGTAIPSTPPNQLTSLRKPLEKRRRAWFSGPFISPVLSCGDTALSTSEAGLLAGLSVPQRYLYSSLPESDLVFYILLQLFFSKAVEEEGR